MKRRAEKVRLDPEGVGSSQGCDPEWFESCCSERWLALASAANYRYGKWWLEGRFGRAKVGEMDWQTRAVLRNGLFKEASTVLEIGAGAYRTSISLAQQYPDKRVVGLDFRLSDAALVNLKDAPGNLSVVKHDARDLQIFGADTFDFVFSIAVMEHIHELREHLAEVYRVLAPGGTYWFIEGPFWSCSSGHHYKKLSGGRCPIPRYAHLSHTPDELRALLLGEGSSKEEADHIVARVYDRPDLSRLSRTQTKSIVEMSEFDVDRWVDDPDEHYSVEGASLALKRGLYPLTSEDLAIKAARVTLRKPKVRMKRQVLGVKGRIRGALSKVPGLRLVKL